MSPGRAIYRGSRLCAVYQNEFQLAAALAFSDLGDDLCVLAECERQAFQGFIECLIWLLRDVF